MTLAQRILCDARKWASSGKLVRVESDHFVAAFVLDGTGLCVHAAPILRKYGFLGRRRRQIWDIIVAKGWHARAV